MTGGVVFMILQFSVSYNGKVLFCPCYVSKGHLFADVQRHNYRTFICVV